MLKTATFGYGPIDVPSSVVLANTINVHLVDGGGNFVQGLDIVPGVTSRDFSVSAGTWKIRVFNKAQDGATIGPVVESDPFSVDEGHTINIVTNIQVV